MVSFFGRFRVSMDAQHRLMIPVRLREGLVGENSGFYVSPGLEERSRYLIAYSQSFWVRITTQFKEFRNLKDGISAERTLKKHFFGRTHSLDMDANGRILLTKDLCDYANLKSKVLLVGMQDFVEIWAEESWQDTSKADEVHKVVENGAKQGIWLY